MIDTKLVKDLEDTCFLYQDDNRMLVRDNYPETYRTYHQFSWAVVPMLRQQLTYESDHGWFRYGPLRGIP